MHFRSTFLPFARDVRIVCFGSDDCADIAGAASLGGSETQADSGLVKHPHGEAILARRANPSRSLPACGNSRRQRRSRQSPRCRRRLGVDAGEIVRWAQNTHVTPGIEHEQVCVAAYDRICRGRESQLQILVVLAIAAVSDRQGRLESDRGASQDCHDAFTSLSRNGAPKFWASENHGNFRVNGGGECKHVRFFGQQQRSLRHAVDLERCAYQG